MKNIKLVNTDFMALWVNRQLMVFYGQLPVEG